MRNDHTGRYWDVIERDSVRYRVESFYASGQKGPEVRADGNGGLLTRGYYARVSHFEMVGPHRTRNIGIDAAIAKATGEDQ